MKKTTLLFLLPGLLLVGCSSESEDTGDGSTELAPDIPSDSAVTPDPAAADSGTAEDAMKAVLNGLKDGKAVVIWNALPASYQNDVNEIVQTFGKNMDPDAWKKATGLIGTVHKLLVDKAEFIANYPAIASGGNGKAKEAIPQVAGLLKTVLDSTSDLESLQKFDGGQFLETTGSSLIKQIEALSQLSPQQGDGPQGLDALADVKVETVDSTDSSATLKMTAPDGKTETQEFVKVDGKWLPKDMAKDWDAKIAQAKEGLAKLPEAGPQMKAQIGAVGGMVSGMLAPLQNAASQEQFNTLMDGLVQNGMGMMMGMGGLGGPPGAGPAFGPPAGPPPEEPKKTESPGDAPAEGADKSTEEAAK